jgi:hypothetical protein
MCVAGMLVLTLGIVIGLLLAQFPLSTAATLPLPKRFPPMPATKPARRTAFSIVPPLLRAPHDIGGDE